MPDRTVLENNQDNRRADARRTIAAMPLETVRVVALACGRGELFEALVGPPVHAVFVEILSAAARERMEREAGAQ